MKREHCFCHICKKPVGIILVKMIERRIYGDIQEPEKQIYLCDECADKIGKFIERIGE